MAIDSSCVEIDRRQYSIENDQWNYFTTNTSINRYGLALVPHINRNEKAITPI